MSKSRYFAATNGKFTIFCASATRVFVGASMSAGAIQFRSRELAGDWPVTEITRARYDLLNGLKNDRLAVAVADTWCAPNNSWVANSAIAAAAASKRAKQNEPCRFLPR